MRLAVLVAVEFAIDPAAMTGLTRGSPATALARQVAMYLAHVELGFDHTTIGICFGRDRTTVAHACRVVEDKRDDVRFDRRMAALELSFHGGDIR